MYGLTRAVTTLVGAALAGILVWLAADAFDDGAIFEADQSGRYWGTVGLLAAAGLAIALSQLFGGWTKWGTPRLSLLVFLVGFLPALIAGLWLLVYVDPGDYWLANKVQDWSNDLGIEDLMQDVGSLFPAVAFALGLLFGLTFDTSGPRVPREEEVTAPPAEERAVERRADAEETAVMRREDDEQTVVERPPRT